jgi:hypothetical protein
MHFKKEKANRLINLDAKSWHSYLLPVIGDG